MFGRFGKDAGSLLGVEITPDSIRMAQLRRRSGRLERVAWAFQAFEPFAAGSGWEDPDRVVAALRSAHRQCGSRQRRAAVALPSSQVICKQVRLPEGQAQSEWEEQLLAQADRLFPFPLEDLVLDFQVLGASPAQPGSLDVLVAACRHRVLQPFEAVFEQAGLQLEAVEVDSIALRRIMPPQSVADSALLRIEPGRMAIHGWRQGILPQWRELPADTAVNPSGDVFGDGVAPAELLVAGASTLEGDVLGQLGENLGLPCRPLPPVEGLDCSDSSMALACALALGSLH